ncbi:MAG: radical SAM protein [Christensenellaceae bacterium]
MYYLLNKEFSLRGWEKLPYCLVDKSKDNMWFLNGKTFEALMLCNGNIDFSLPIISNETRDIVKELEKEKIVTACAAGEELCEKQKYRQYNNRFIRRAHWSITGKCNYRCKHCYMSAPDAKLGELDSKTVMDIVEQIAQCGIAEVSLTGGEPLVRKDFMEIVDALLEHDIAISQIYSNGKLVNEHLLKELDARGIHPEFNMSYDGDDGWHDWLRGMDNAGEIVLHAFDLCHEMGFPTGAEMCLHQGNKQLLRKSINTLAAHHCTSIKTNPVADTELWKKYGKDYTISLEEVFELYFDYIPHFFEDGMPISVMLGGFFMCGKGKTNWAVPMVKGEGKACEGDTICGHARSTLYISPESRMLPCLSLSAYPLQEDYPKITDIGLRQGLSDSTYMKLIDTRLKEYWEINAECARCAYKTQCGGGCRASALISGEADIMAPDRASCLFFKGGYYERVNKAAALAVETIENKV